VKLQLQTSMEYQMTIISTCTLWKHTLSFCISSKQWTPK